MQADQTGNRRSPDELWAGLVAEMTTMPDVVANLLREHQPDEQGLCRFARGHQVPAGRSGRRSAHAPHPAIFRRSRRWKHQPLSRRCRVAR